MPAYILHNIVRKLTTYSITVSYKTYTFYFIVFMFKEITDPFVERMGFSKYNNQFGNLVDDAYDLVMYGYQVSAAIASSICLVTIPKKYTPCGVYMINNNTKYFLAKRDCTKECWG